MQVVEGQQQHQEDAGHGQQDARQQPVALVRYLVENPYRHRSRQQETGVAQDGCQVVARLVGQRAGGAEHLDDRDDAQAEEDDPYHLVALEYVA